jgi:signal transduction histidine kinase
MTNLNASATPQLTAAVQRQLDLAHSQLALYARDLKRIVDAERQRARQLAEANARLQILDRLKTDFLSFIVHELRTPLTGITLAIDFLDPHGDPQEQAKTIERIRKGYERLQRLVQKGLEYFDWLTVEQINTSDTTDLVKVIWLVTKRTRGLVEPGVDFRLSITDAPGYVHGEEQHLIKVVEILLDNALKFSSKKRRFGSMSVLPLST